MKLHMIGCSHHNSPIEVRERIAFSPDLGHATVAPEVARAVAEAVGVIDRQMSASRFRGVRPMGRLDAPLPAGEVLGALAERGLLFEVMAHPHQLEAVAAGLAAFDELVVVVEHTGWPRSGSDEELALWKAGMQALAGLGEHVVALARGDRGEAEQPAVAGPPTAPPAGNAAARWRRRSAGLWR